MLTKLFISCFFLCTMSRMTLSQKKAKNYCSGIQDQLPKDYSLGGSKTKNAEFPHMVALGYGEPANPKWLCGGSLITAQYVVTTAHCAETKAGPVIVVRLGTITAADVSLYHKDVDVDHITVHPDYNPPSYYNDIALLKLAKHIITFDQIYPACLHTTASINAKELTALVWEKTTYGSTSNHLLNVELRTFTRSFCNEYYENVSRKRLHRGISNKTQVCAGSDDEAKDTCQGDSGGPLEYIKEDNHYIVGLTSFGRACGSAGVPAVYTRISAYVKWIESVVWN